MMTALLMRLPDPGGATGIADVDGVLAKAGFNPDEPRDEQGRWTTGGSNDDADYRATGIQLADAGFSDVSNDPVAEATARAAAAARHNHESRASRDKPDYGAGAGGANNWTTRFRDFWAAIVAFLGNPQNTTRAEEDTHALASRILGSHLSKLRGVRAIYYHTKLSTITKGQIQSGRLPDVTVEMEDNTLQPYEILSPKQTARDVTSKYADVRPIGGSKFRLADVKVMSKEEIMSLPEAAPIAAAEAAEEEAQAAIAAQEEEEETSTLGNP